MGLYSQLSLLPGRDREKELEGCPIYLTYSLFLSWFLAEKESIESFWTIDFYAVALNLGFVCDRIRTREERTFKDSFSVSVFCRSLKYKTINKIVCPFSRPLFTKTVEVN